MDATFLLEMWQHNLWQGGAKNLKDRVLYDWVQSLKKNCRPGGAFGFTILTAQVDSGFPKCCCNKGSLT
jgi:hypothetical protein